MVSLSNGLIDCDDRGLVVGSGTPLVRMGDKGRLAVEPDAARCIALLSILSRKPVAPEVLRPIEAAAAYWAAGDKALANLRLVFSGLPKLRSATDAACVEAAAWCLDQGLAPRDLIKALDLDPSVLDVRKFDPDQPRVPAGSGRDSGRWTDAESGERFLEGQQPLEVQVAANGPFKPEGIEANPSTSVDPLDPAGLNKTPPSPDPQGYKSYDIRSSDSVVRGEGRLVVSNSGNAAYYTPNHYFSFYGVDMEKSD